jgi:hypothetical protein
MVHKIAIFWGMVSAWIIAKLGFDADGGGCGGSGDGAHDDEVDEVELSLLFLNDEALHDGVSRTFGLGHPVEEVIAGDGRVMNHGLTPRKSQTPQSPFDSVASLW